ncbi:MAG: radical SAM protein [Bacteroidales bacterium]|nr:radical SAM protein [Bacteroidales bacterium]
MKEILLVIPPFTQLNNPYPATAYLKGFLNTKNISSFQIDLGIEVINELFTKEKLGYLFDFAFKNNRIKSDNSFKIYGLRNEYLFLIDNIIAFLQGKNQTFARQICSYNFLPQASRFQQLEYLDSAFGNMGLQDKAKHLATLFIEDLSDFIVECVDRNFGFSRYAEKLALSANYFDELYSILKQKPSYIDTICLKILNEKISEFQPKLVGFSVPFPGNLYSAFRGAQFIKNKYPNIKIVMGGGFANTEFRSLSDIRVFEFFDYITLDDGELPLELIFNEILTENKGKNLKRTFILENDKVVYINSSEKKDYLQKEVGIPDYSDFQLDKYLSVIEIANPMHSLWSDGKWNKLTMAHGCYWAKCTFCDISLDYIKRYDATTAVEIVDKIEKIIDQTGEKGFHFVDEAAPPALMKAVAIELLKRKLSITWWTNVRFEKSFTLDICILLKKSGCIAVSGGLEVASDRLLSLINKGVTVEQVAQVTSNFTEAGILVHAYLMYGFPTQTQQETVDSLEMVRQMFELGIIQSGFWHQFALTVHSHVGQNPDLYNITPEFKNASFANNDVQFKDKTGINHNKFSFGLKKSIFNYMHGTCFDYPLQDWFDFKIPNTTVKENLILRYLESEEYVETKPNNRIIWIGNLPFVRKSSNKKKEILDFTFYDNSEQFQFPLDKRLGEWLIEILDKLSISSDFQLTYAMLKADYEKYFEDFDLFWFSKPVDILKICGLLVI